MKEYNTAAIETKKTFYTRYNSDKNTLPIELANKVDTPSLDGCTVYICCRRGGGGFGLWVLLRPCPSWL